MAPTTQLLLKGKLAVITGAASTIGRAIATKFVEHGASVMLADTEFNSCQDIANELNKTYNTHNNKQVAVAKFCDVRHESNIVQAIQEAKAAYSRQHLDIFYSNAMINHDVSPLDYDIFKETIKVNVESVLASIKHASAEMMMPKTNNIGGGGGCILCTGSTTGLLGDVVPSAYSISKTAVVSVVRATAAQLAKDGVRVNAISPHRVAPSFDESVLKKIFPKANRMELDDMIAGYMSSRVVTEVDVANAAVYLASDASKNSKEFPFQKHLKESTLHIYQKQK